MLQELKFQLSTAILTVLTLGAVAAAAINFEQQQKFRFPEDGVIWVDRDGGVEALYVAADSGAGKAGLNTGDRCEDRWRSIGKAVNVAQVLATVGSWTKADYPLNRGGYDFRPRKPRRTARPRGVVPVSGRAAYLLIGLFVYFRRGSAQMARHFYFLCLVSFVSSGFITPAS